MPLLEGPGTFRRNLLTEIEHGKPLRVARTIAAKQEAKRPDVKHRRRPHPEEREGRPVKTPGKRRVAKPNSPRAMAHMFKRFL